MPHPLWYSSSATSTVGPGTYWVNHTFWEWGFWALPWAGFTLHGNLLMKNLSPFEYVHFLNEKTDHLVLWKFILPIVKYIRRTRITNTWNTGTAWMSSSSFSFFNFLIKVLGKFWIAVHTQTVIEYNLLIHLKYCNEKAQNNVLLLKQVILNSFLGATLTC